MIKKMKMKRRKVANIPSKRMCLLMIKKMKIKKGGEGGRWEGDQTCVPDVPRCYKQVSHLVPVVSHWCLMPSQH